MTATSLSRVLRSVRLALAPPRSLLRRPSDRLETAALRGGVLLVILLVPFLLSIGSTVTESARRDGEIARSTRHTVTATVAWRDGSPVPFAEDLRAGGGRTGVEPTHGRVRWTTPDGVEHTADTIVPSTAQLGTPVTVWVDRDERLTHMPPASGEALGHGVSAVLGLFTAVVALVAAVLALLRFGLDRVRHREWEREWALIGRLGDGSTR